jgi:CMP-N-acetylneuraminic acid synthetase
MSYKHKKILAIIPARSGSKRLPGKNTKLLNGKPMIAYAIQAAKKSRYIDRIVVSTDDVNIANIAQKFGAEVPFIRPSFLALDDVPTLPVLQHAVDFYENNLDFKPDLIVLVQPTSPFVTELDIDGTIDVMFKTGTKGAFSGVETSQKPEWMYNVTKNIGKKIIKNNETAKKNRNLSRLAIINGAVYVMQRESLRNNNIIDNDSTAVYIMPKDRSIDVDDIFDFEIAEFLFQKNEKNNKNRK